MMLNKDEIIQRGLIVGGCSRESMPDVGYNLRIATLIGKGPDGKTETYNDDFDLEPSGIAAVVSKETVKLPGDVCAYASVKTGLCREGVLAINIGIIDPGWEGPISSFLLNFGKDLYRLKNGEEFLRLTFHSLTRAKVSFFLTPTTGSHTSQEFELSLTNVSRRASWTSRRRRRREVRSLQVI